MAERLGVVLQKPQRHPPGEPFGLGIFGPAGGKPVLLRQPPRFGNEAGFQGLARQDGTLDPPFLGDDLVLGRVDQQFTGRIIAALAAAPAHPLVNEARMVAKLFRYPGNGRINAAPAVHQRQTGLGQGAGLGIHPPQHAPGGPVAVGPEQPLQSRSMVVGGQELSVAGVEMLFLGRSEIAVDPGRTDRGATRLGLSGRQQGGGAMDEAVGADRRERLEPLENVPGGRGVCDRLLGAAAQQYRRRPIGMFGHEPGDGLEIGVGIGAGIIQPMEQRGEGRVMDAAGLVASGLPLILVDGREHRFGGRRIGFAEGMGRQREDKHGGKRRCQAERRNEKPGYAASHGAYSTRKALGSQPGTIERTAVARKNAPNAAVGRQE